MPKSRSNWYWQLGIVSLLATGSAIASSFSCAFAQITPDSTLGNESSEISPSDDINGEPGTQIDGGAIRGENLFHSFGEFSVPTGSAAYFNNASEVQNIINRVTGGNVSNIDGLLKANGTANLFLINPNGIIFGSNARLDIGGSFIGSTASSVKFPDGTEFSATDTQSEPLLSVNIPIGLQFGGNPGKIQVQGNGEGIRFTNDLIDTDVGLRVPSDRTLALVGGDLELSGATLKTAGGRIELGSVDDFNLVSLALVDNGVALGYQGIENFRNIQLSQRSSVDAGGEGGGDIQVRGRQIRLTNGSQIEASTLGAEEGGILSFKASNLIELSGTSGIDEPSVQTTLSSRSNSTGRGGNLNLKTEQLIVKDGAQISTSASDRGNAGNILINASDLVELKDISSNGQFPSGVFARTPNVDNGGDAGNLTIETGNLIVKDGGQISATTSGQGNAGNILINASDLVELKGVSSNGQFTSGLIARTLRSGQAGNLTVNTNKMRITNSAIVDARTITTGNGGNITINVDTLEAFRGGQIIASSFEDSIGNAGNITVNATDKVTISDSISSTRRIRIGNNLFVDEPSKSGLFVRSQGLGDAGKIKVTARSIELSNGGEITAETTSGKGGDIDLQIQDSLLLRAGSKITSTAGLEGTGGDGGNITINSPLIIGFPLSNSDITANAFQGRGGNIDITTEAIFGFEERRSIPTNQTNDIDASSEFGLNGRISIDISDIDPSKGLVELLVKLTTPEPLQTCQARRGQSGSSFINTGRGGLSPGTEEISNNTVWEDWRSPLFSENNSLDSQSINFFTNSKSESITEAQGWIITPNNNVILTANPSTVTPSSYEQKSSSCLIH